MSLDAGNEQTITLKLRIKDVYATSYCLDRLSILKDMEGADFENQPEFQELMKMWDEIYWTMHNASRFGMLT